MKKDKIIYRASTGLLCTFFLLTGVAYFTDAKFITIFQHLGFPPYFRMELGAAKIIGGIVLLLPQAPARMKEWAYVAFGITLISGAIAHGNSGDPLGYMLNVFFFFALLVVSYLYWHKRLGSQQAQTLSETD